MSRYLRHADEASVRTARRGLEGDQSGFSELFANGMNAPGSDRLQAAEIHIGYRHPSGVAVPQSMYCRKKVRSHLGIRNHDSPPRVRSDCVSAFATDAGRARFAEASGGL